MKRIIFTVFLLALTYPLFSQNVNAKLEYVTNMGGGVYYATLGYDNVGSNSKTIPIGSGNKFTPNPMDRGQPTTFLPGRHYEVFSVPVTYGASLVWNLSSNASITCKNIFVNVTDSLNSMPGPGGTVKYYIYYKNFEGNSCSQVTIQDTLPVGLSFISATGGGTLNGNIVTWNIGSIPGGNSGLLTLTLSVSSLQANYKNAVVMFGKFSSSFYRAYSKKETVGQQGVTVISSYLAAFEDLKCSGYCDWDQNDFVASVKQTVTANGSSQITRIVYDYEALARGSTYNHSFCQRVAVLGNSTVSLIVRDSNNAIMDSLSFSNKQCSGTIDEIIFPNTMSALPPISQTNKTCNTNPSQEGVIKGYKAQLIINLNSTQNTLNNFGTNAADPYIIVRPNTIYSQFIHIASIGGSLGNIQSVSNVGAISAQLYGFYLDLGHKLPFNWKWPLEGTNYAIWKSYTKFVDYILSAKAASTDWYNFPDSTKTWNRRVVPPQFCNFGNNKNLNFGKQSNYSPDYVMDLKLGKFFASPKLADINNDNKLEIFVGSLDKNFYGLDANGNMLPGFPIVTNSFIKSTAAIYKKSNGQFIIAFGNDNGELYVVNQLGQPLPNYPKLLTRAIVSSPVITNLFGGNDIQVIAFTSDGKVNVFDENGNFMQGFPKKIQNFQNLFGDLILMSTPALFDVNSDGKKEIVVGTIDSTLEIISYNGNVLTSTQLDGGIVTSPHIIKINGEVKIVAATSSGTIYRLSNNGSIESYLTVASDFVSSPVVADINNDNIPEIICAGMDGNVSVVSATNYMQLLWQTSVGQEIVATPLIADIDGGNDLDILITVKGGYMMGLSKDGYLLDSATNASLAPFDSWTTSTPALGDVDNNGKLDVVETSYDSTLKVFELPNANANAQIIWGCFGGNMNNNNVNPINVRKIENNTIPVVYKLDQNYPNPFNPVTKIHYQIPENKNVTLKVFDMLGKEVVTLVNQYQKTGNYEVTFDAKNLSSGIYFYTLDVGDFRQTMKMVVIK